MRWDITLYSRKWWQEIPFPKYTPIYICQLVGYLMLCICGTTRILQRSTILESTNPSKVMVPISFWQVFPMLGKSKIQGSMIILISHFGIKNILAPTKVRNANLSLSKIIKGFLQCSLAIFIQWSIMNCKIHSKTKPSLIYNNNFQLLNNSYWIHHKL